VLSSILGSVRDDWKLKKPKREPRPETTDPILSTAHLSLARDLDTPTRRELNDAGVVHTNTRATRSGDQPHSQE